MLGAENMVITDEMVHAALKVQHPKVFGEFLRHPGNGLSKKAKTESTIETVRDMIAAALAHRSTNDSGVGAAEPVQAPADDFKAKVFELLGCGSDVSENVALEGLRNLVRREACLSAVEREFFMVATPPDVDEGETEPGEECLLRWGQTPEGYVKDFGGAVHNLGMMMASISPAARLVLTERSRQLKGYSPEEDDRYTGCELAAAAATYAICTKPEQLQCMGVRVWPWAAHTWHNTTYRRNLAKAGALILAEIERLDRKDGAAGYNHQVGAFNAPLTLAELMEVRRAVGELVGTDRTSVAMPLLARAVQEGYISCEQFSVANVDALDQAIDAAQAVKEL